MNKLYLLSAAMLLSAATPSMVSAEPVEYGNRDFYGFFLSNGDYVNGVYGEYGFARQTFSTPQDNELIYRMGNGMGVYAAAAVDGVYYFAPYHFTSSLEPPAPLPMMKFNIYSGEVEEIGNWNDGDLDFKLWDMTYDRKNDRLLALGMSPVSGMCIYEVNRSTGALTRLRGLDPSGGVIACDAFGRVFTITVNGELYQVDMSSETRQIKLCDLDYSMLLSHQSLEFDLTANKLYWASNCYNNPNGQGVGVSLLVEIKLPNVGPDQDYVPGEYATNEISEIGYDATFLGMYIPYCSGGFNAPGMATDIKAVSAADGSSCNISFKAPTVTFGGEPLASIDGFDILRDGKRISTIRGIEPGATGEYLDTDIPASGEYRYDIVCYSNTNGDGPKSPVFAYVGYDRPAAVDNIKVNVSDDFTKTEITWDAPTAGAKGGTFDPAETRYDVFRLPDNVALATDLAEPRFSDSLRRLLRYSYRITAKNAYGESVAYSDEFIAGPPVTEFPLEESFDNVAATKLKWNVVDYNEDNQTWIFDSDFSHGVFGDYETSADYILSPTTVDENVSDADDWIISPPIKFGDDNYAVEFQIRTLTPEHFSVFVGGKNTPEFLTEDAGDFEVNTPEYDDESGLMKFQKYVVKLPGSVRNSIACVGVCLDTLLPDNIYGYAQISNILIDTADNILAVGSVSDDKFSVSIDSYAVKVSGTYRSGAVYNVAGQLMRVLSGESTDVSDLPSGVYVVTVDDRSYKLMK